MIEKLCITAQRAVLLTFIFCPLSSFADEPAAVALKKTSLAKTQQMSVAPEKRERFSMGLIRTRNQAHRALMQALMDPDSSSETETKIVKKILSANSLLTDIRVQAIESNQDDLAKRIRANQLHYLNKIANWYRDIEDSPELKETLRSLYTQLKSKS